MTACAQCRHRKVRCQGAPPRCSACTRLGFQCSFDQPASPVVQDLQLSALRKRGSRACDACRAQRSKCSAESPACSRCIRRSISCNYTLPVRQYLAGNRKKSDMAAVDGDPDRTAPSGAAEAVLSPAAPDSYGFNSLLGCEKTVIEDHITAYFEHVYPVTLYSFLHRADLLSRYSSGTLPDQLLLAVCGVSSRFLSSPKTTTFEARSWIERAETIVFQNLGKSTIADLQTLMLLTLYRAHNLQNDRTFLYLGLASRMAYSLKLHKEGANVSFIEQESRRRLLWCIFVMDRLNAGGIPEYIVVPTTSLHIQLPCIEHFYESDVAIKTPQLVDGGMVDNQMSLSALLLKIFEIRTHILQYTKQLLDTETSPETSLDRFRYFEGELSNLRAVMPTELTFSVRAFQLRAFSPERNIFIVFHLYYHHCHCELYRLLNPGYREALPQLVIQGSSAELVMYAQAKCLEHAMAIGDIVLSTYELVRIRPYVSDVTLFVVLYQASCAILYACHRDSPSYTMNAITARAYFVVFIKILEAMLPIFPRFVIFVNDIRNMLRSIDDPNAPLPAQKSLTEVDFRARPVPSEDNLDEEHKRSQQGWRLPADGSSRQPFSEMGHFNLHPDGGHGSLQRQPQTEFQEEWLSEYSTGGSHSESSLQTFFDEGLLWDWADALNTSFTS